MSASSRAVIDAPIDLVWEVLHDLEAMQEWQPDFQAARCLERDAHGRPILVHAVLDTVVRRTEVTLKLNYDTPGVMRWKKHSGDVPSFVGSWTASKLGPARTAVEYQLEIDFGRLGKLVRGPLANALAGATTSSMPGKLKAYVESLVAAELAREARTRVRKAA